MKKIFALFLTITLLIMPFAMAEESTCYRLWVSDPVYRNGDNTTDLTGATAMLQLSKALSGMLGLNLSVLTGEELTNRLIGVSAQLDENGLSAGLDGGNVYYTYDLTSYMGEGYATTLMSSIAAFPIDQLLDSASASSVKVDYSFLAALLQPFMAADGASFAVDAATIDALMSQMNVTGLDELSLSGTLSPVGAEGFALTLAAPFVTQGTPLLLEAAVTYEAPNGEFEIVISGEGTTDAIPIQGTFACAEDGGYTISGDASGVVTFELAHIKEEDGANTMLTVNVMDEFIKLGYDIVGGVEDAIRGQVALVSFEAVGANILKADMSFNCSLGVAEYVGDTSSWAYDSSNAELIPAAGPTEEQMTAIQEQLMGAVMGAVFSGMSDVPGLMSLVG